MGPVAEPKDVGGLRRKAERLTNRLLVLASRHFRTELPIPAVRFDLRGKCAGQVRTTDSRGFLIRYNAQLLQRHPRTFLSRTVPHETAHVVAFGLFGPRIPPHGQEWRAIMTFFGASPERCHSYDVEGLQTRRLRQYEYHCDCSIHHLTSIRHNRASSGTVYLCKQCGQPLQQLRKPVVD